MLGFDNDTVRAAVECCETPDEVAQCAREAALALAAAGCWYRGCDTTGGSVNRTVRTQSMLRDAFAAAEASVARMPRSALMGAEDRERLVGLAASLYLANFAVVTFGMELGRVSSVVVAETVKAEAAAAGGAA